MSWLFGKDSNASGSSGTGTRPTRNLPTINYFEAPLSDEEGEFAFDDETGELEFNPLVSPRRPHQSPSVSPRALLQPDQPHTEDLLKTVNDKLAGLTPVDAEVVEEGHVVGLPEGKEVSAGDIDEGIMAQNFDVENGTICTNVLLYFGAIFLH